MRPDEFSKMRALESAHWWFQGRRHLLRGLMRTLCLRDALVLDAGCGTGFARGELSKAGTVIGLDASEAAFALAPGGDQGASCVGLIERAPFQDGTFDLVVALDLLEHLEDDTRALGEIYRICRPGGFLFATVPACQRVWSRHDEALGHYRRYSAAELAKRVRLAGFEIRKSSYTVTTLFPLAAAYRILRRRFGRDAATTDLFPVPEPLNAVLGLLMRFESWLALRVNLPFGLSAFILARKIAESDDCVLRTAAGGSER